MDFLIHWPPGPVVATVQCQGLVSVLSNSVCARFIMGVLIYMAILGMQTMHAMHILLAIKMPISKLLYMHPQLFIPTRNELWPR